MKRRSETVSFRADEELLRLIDEARKPFGISRGDWVRGVTQSQLLGRNDQLDLTPLTALQSGQEELVQGVGKLYTGLARVLFVLLTQVGQLAAEEAKEIVRKALP